MSREVNNVTRALPFLLAAFAAPPVMAATGGPDGFGYTYIDSEESDGPTYAWTDISGTGTDTKIDDDGEVTISLPFNFYFYGTAYAEVTVGDGALLFGSSTRINNRNGCLPDNNSDGDDALALPMWDDLNAEETKLGGVFWEVLGTAPERQLVIQYEAVPHYGSRSFYTFQAILLESGSQILFQYASIDGDDEYANGASATVGIQQDQKVGLEYACESEEALSDGLAILFDVECEDTDGDGAGDCDGDCLEGDPDVGPFATEEDDGVDNDCDGLVDEDYVAVGDVVINEMMPYPFVTDDEDGEWFELYNASSRTVDLFGWTISDSSGSVQVDEHVLLEAGEYGLFAAHPDPLRNGNLPDVDWVFDWDTMHLNNTGDDLVIGMGSTVIDELSYDPNPWIVTEGGSMFLDPSRQDATSNDDFLPWCATPFEADYDYGGLGVGDYGTPGEPNPESLCCHDDDGDGSDVCDGDCDDADANRFPENPEVQDLIDNDCDGVADEDWVTAGALVITEFLDEPSAVEQSLGEWFEIQNVGEIDLNLLGWEIGDEYGDGFTIEEDLVVAPGDHLLFAVESDAALNGNLPEPDYVYPYNLFPLRSYDDDDIQIVYGEEVMDAVYYSNVTPWCSEPGRSSYLCPDATDVDANDDPAVWSAIPADEAYDYGGAGSGDYGTPGSENPGDIDEDGDGWGLCEGDCDDLDASVGMGTTEDCENDLDDDCDGLVDAEDEDCQPGDSGDTSEPQDSPPTDDTDGEDSPPDDTGDGDGKDDCGGCASGGGAWGGALLALVFALVLAGRRSEDVASCRQRGVR